MKQLSLQSPSYAYAERGFQEWLDILGYAPTTVYNLPNAVRELLHCMEAKGLNQLLQITSLNISDYYDHLKERGNLTRGGGLSNAYLNKHQQAIKLFATYLRQTGRVSLPSMEWESEGNDTAKIDVLTLQEVMKLYEAAAQLPESGKHKKGREFSEFLGHTSLESTQIYTHLNYENDG
jgi:integrase/recombinase XerD